MSSLYKCQKPQFFKCLNDKCISNSFVCDGENDCDDFSDEKNCHNFTLNVESKCEEGFWRCTDHLCIPVDWVCNGVHECLDGSDETIGCSSKIKCDQFQCKNGNCVPTEWVCDGTDDCHDNSDEKDCENNFPIDQCTLDNRKFLCNNNKTCINLHLVCDNSFECPDHSDEGKLCNTKSSPCKCSHDCISLPTGTKCLCPTGYHTVDDKNCLDINECEVYGICDQQCRNTPGSYECLCNDKYYLLPDGKTCKARGGNGVLFFSTKTEIRGLTLDSKSYFTVSNNLKQVVGVDYDGHNVYWTEVFTGHESIARSIEDGSDREVLVSSGLGLPEDLAVDWLTGNIYFTDVENKHIGVCTYSGAHCTVILNKDIRKPRGIVVNVEGGDMYWTDWGVPPQIGYSLMDGSKDRPFVVKDIRWPNGLALDQPNERLYWADAKKMTLESIKLDGTDRRVILQGIVKHPYAIAVFQNQLYWSDWKTHTIQTCDKFNGKNHHTLVEEHKNVIYGISIFHDSLQERSVNPCDTAFCSDICLLSGQTYSCACPENKILDKDGHLCKEVIPSQMLMGGAGNLLINIEHQYLGKHGVILLPDVVKHVGSLAFDSFKNVLYVSDLSTKTIVALSMYTGVTKILDITDLGLIVSMDFDSMSNNLYICDLDREVVEVIDINTNARKILIHDTFGEIPSSIALVPKEGVMFVSFKDDDKGSNHIDRFFMDGTGRTHVIEINLAGQISMTYDRELHRIFFADTDTGIIESTSIEGDDRHHFRTLDTHPFSLASLKDHMFWINTHSKELFWTDKKSSSSYDKSISLDLQIVPEHIHLISITLNKHDTNACRLNNNGCSHLCILSHKSIVCLCPTGWELSSDNRTCIKRISCNADEFSCPHSNACVLKSLRCNGHNDCAYGEDEVNCVEKPKCPSDQYQCNNGDCINEDLICDHKYDCIDKSDEDGCEDRKKKIGCPSDYFTCKNLECIPQKFVCDGIPECDDDSDEINCEENVCTDKQFRCDSGACIPKAWECDREFDCHDNSDEHCSWDDCPSNYYKCENNKCIDSTLICDGVNDCGDHSDEQIEMCRFHKKNSNCLEEEMACASNASLCVPLSARCNGTSECPKNEDEIGCVICADDEFECRTKQYKQCIPDIWMCDNNNDCGDNSDEDKEICSNKNKHVVLDTSVAQPCSNGFRCSDGACLDVSLVCNGKSDCYDGSDEGGLCSASCVGMKNPCNQICVKTPNGPSCECKSGYTLMGNGKTCVDDDECAWDPPMCSQLCLNKEGGYSCRCYHNFLLGNDEKSCKADGSRMLIYFVVYNNQIRQLIPQSNAMAVISSNLMTKISSLDTLFEPNTIFFSSDETRAIYKLDPSKNVIHYIRNVGVPQKIAVDWSTQNIYYYNTESSSKSIGVCSFEGKCAKLIVVDQHRQVSALAVDSFNGVFFYVLRDWWILETPSYAIYKSNLDGSVKTELVKTTNGNVEDITYDLNKKLLYFKDEESETINFVSYKGGIGKTLFYNVTQSKGLQFFEDHLYYLELDGRIVSCKLYDSRQCRRKFGLHNFASGQFSIEQKSLQPPVENVCSGHKCPYLCVPGNNGYKCLCHDGNVGNATDSCGQNDNIQSEDKHKFTVHSTPVLENNATKKHPGPVAAAVLVPIFLVLTAAVVYYVLRKKSEGGLNVRMRFYNPLYGKHIDDQKQILQPGQHEYANPMLVNDEISDDEHAKDATRLLNGNIC